MPSKLRDDFEGYVSDILSGEMLKNALDFAAFLKANDMSAGGEHGAAKYKGKCICYMFLEKGEEMPAPWTIWSEGDYSVEHKDVPISQHLKEIAWAKVNICTSCGGKCSPGASKVIFGKEFVHVCSAAMAFYMPDAEVLECVKKLLEIRKCEIDAM